MSQCKAELAGDVLVLETGRIRRTCAWNHGHLITRRIEDPARGRVWETATKAPDFEMPGVAPTEGGGELRVTEQPQTPRKPAHLCAEVTCRLDGLRVRRSFRLYPGCPAIACDLAVRGRWPEAGRKEPVVVERLALPHRHLRATAVQFFDVTDARNNLAARRTIFPYYAATTLTGNLLLVQDLLADRGFFMLKEAPCSDAQLDWPGYDFRCLIGDVQVVGAGTAPDEVVEAEWTRCYGTVTGVAGADERDLLAALRACQAAVRRQAGRRDHMIMLNTWGDRSGDARINEAFTMRELEAGARLGATHLQLDHGWEAGRGGDMSLSAQLLSNIWGHPGFWNANPQRFPNGLGPAVERARKLGIELCLWFVPSAADDYAHWRQDAEVLIGLHRSLGLRTFKIDSVELPTRRADTNFRALLDSVMDATGQEAVFNLDATAGRRFGYHYLTEYGNIFVENRYTDWANYYPHWTLRNLWTLSRYVPPQHLQIEFLNRWRNAQKYPDDPLAPSRVPFDYCFAITMAAQPLAWFEASGLPEEAFAIAPLVRTYLEHQNSIHEGAIFPIGEEPCGTGWTGLQSVRPDGGYFFIFRELNERPGAALDTWGLAGSRVECRPLGGSGQAFTARVAADGRLAFSLPGPFTFAFYEYRLV